MEDTCEHLDQIKKETMIQKSSIIKFECEECVKMNSWWVHLRLCQTCGKVLCCDSSPNQHASKHAAEAGHPVATSAQPGENWAWCYLDEKMKDL